MADARLPLEFKLNLATMSKKTRLDILNLAYNAFLSENGIKPSDDPYILLAAMVYEVQQLRHRMNELEAKLEKQDG